MKSGILIVLTVVAMSLLWGCKETKKPFPPATEEALVQLDEAIANAQKYKELKYKEIDSINRTQSKVPQNDYSALCRINTTLSKMFGPLNGDSALYYARKAEKYAALANDPSAIISSDIAEVRALTYGGYYLEAMKKLESVGDSALSHNLKLDYWDAGLYLYLNLAAFVPKSEYQTQYLNKALAYSDSLLTVIPHSNIEHRYYYGEQLYYNGQYQHCLEVLSDVSQHAAPGGGLESRTYLVMAWAAKELRKNDVYIEYLARAARLNIMNAQYDGLALGSLANFLFEQGDVENAYEYLNFNIKMAAQGNGRMRSLSMAAALPTIQEAYEEKMRDSETVYFVILGVVALIAAAFLILAVYYKRRTRKISELTKQLETTTRLQENNMGHFIALCVNYVDKLDNFSSLLKRKLAAGQVEEALNVIKNESYTTRNNEEFNKVFDSTFISVYPDYVQEFNKLLRKEERLEIKKIDELTPELRIFAMIKLGLSVPQISRILNYSVNTLYVYRNKMRAKAISKDTFDDDVRNLCRKNSEKFL